MNVVDDDDQGRALGEHLAGQRHQGGSHPQRVLRAAVRRGEIRRGEIRRYELYERFVDTAEELGDGCEGQRRLGLVAAGDQRSRVVAEPREEPAYERGLADTLLAGYRDNRERTVPRVRQPGTEEAQLRLSRDKSVGMAEIVIDSATGPAPTHVSRPSAG